MVTLACIQVYQNANTLTYLVNKLNFKKTACNLFGCETTERRLSKNTTSLILDIVRRPVCSLYTMTTKYSETPVLRSIDIKTIYFLYKTSHSSWTSLLRSYRWKLHCTCIWENNDSPVRKFHGIVSTVAVFISFHTVAPGLSVSPYNIRVLHAGVLKQLIFTKAPRHSQTNNH